MERDTHREFPSEAADLPLWMQGMWIAKKWVEYNVVPERLHEEVSIHARLRDHTIPVCSSLEKALEGDFFYWMDRDRDKFRSAMSTVLKRDTLLLERLLQLREFCHERLMSVPPDDHHRTPLECSILEAAVSIDRLGSEYVPKEITEEKNAKRKKKRMRWPDMSWLSTEIPLPKLQKGLAAPNRTNEKSGQMPEQTNQPPKTPLLFKKTVLGKDRRRRIRAGNEKMLSVDSWSSQFMVDKVWDAFDPTTGDLSCNAPRRSMEMAPEKSYDNVPTSVYLNPKDLALTDELSVPRPLVSGYDFGQRWKNLSSSSRYRLSTIDIRTAGGTTIIGTDALLPFLQEDSLGNITLSLDSGLLSMLPKQQVLLQSQFSCDYTDRMTSVFCSPDATHMQKLDDHLKDRLLRFLPPKVAQLLEAIMQKSERGFLRDESAMQLLVSYLGNHYLTYHKNDAPPLKNDPASFTQADRVLHQRSATCEGAHVALAPLLQSLLQDGEGINFVTGFVTEGHGQNTSCGSDYHMQMLCSRQHDANAFRQLVLLDATPWAPRAQRQIRKKSKLRTGVRNT